MSDVALAARGLTVRYGGLTALDRIDIEVPAGASVALLGPNGSGKSTLLAAAVGLVEPDEGAIEVQSGRIAYVPQHLALEPAFPVTVRDVVRMGRYGDLGWIGRFSTRDRELVAAALDTLGIEELAGRRFGTLSGGQRQRALLAQAVAQDADVMLLDEPFTGVDAPTGEAIRRLLGSWRERGRTVLVATHDLRAAQRDYDLVLCLNRRLIAFGPPALTCAEDVLRETFAGLAVRVGETLIDVEHHHEDAG